MEEKLNEIHDQFMTASQHYCDVVDKMAELEEEGVWRAVPTLSYKDAARKYAELRFPHQFGRPTGPDGKAKIYIGSKTEKIEGARSQISRTIRYLKLLETKTNLQIWFNGTKHKVSRLAKESESWPYSGLALDTD